MTVYFESSAVLAWLLGEVDSPRVLAALGGGADVVASDLTLVECDRSLVRAAASGRVDEAEAKRRRGELGSVARFAGVSAPSGQNRSTGRRALDLAVLPPDVP